MLRSDLPVALPLHLFLDYDDADGVDLDQAAADVGVFIVPFKCEVFLGGLIMSEACNGTVKGVVAFDKRVTAGSDVGRLDAEIANFNCGTTAAGKVLYDEAAKGEILEPGDEVVVEIVTRPTEGTAAGHFLPILLVKEIPETPANLSNMVETA